MVHDSQTGPKIHNVSVIPGTRYADPLISTVVRAVSWMTSSGQLGSSWLGKIVTAVPTIRLRGFPCIKDCSVDV